MPNNKYVIDTNVFIQSKNREYRFEFCEGFWDWIKVGHADSCLLAARKCTRSCETGTSRRSVQHEHGQRGCHSRSSWKTLQTRRS